MKFNINDSYNDYHEKSGILHEEKSIEYMTKDLRRYTINNNQKLKNLRFR